MKTNSRKQLVEKSKSLFNSRNENKLFATTDGQFFVHQDRANMHAQVNREIPLKVYKIDRNEVEEDAPKEDEAPKALPSVAKLKELLPEVSEVGELEAILEQEKSGEDRKTAIEAIQERIEELNTND